MRAIGYLRVSTDEQVQEGVSLPAQEAKLRAWAELNDAVEVMICEDRGLSGKRADNRPGLQRALDTAQPGDALVVYSLSRLARSTKDTIHIAELLDRKQANLVSLSENIDTTTAAGKMVFRMLAVLSEFERDQVSERTRLALQHKRANGQKTGGDVPYGFQLVEGALVPDPDEQAVIEHMRALKAAGESLRGICQHLERAGHQTKTGLANWNPKTVAAIIQRNRSETLNSQ